MKRGGKLSSFIFISHSDTRLLHRAWKATGQKSHPSLIKYWYFYARCVLLLRDWDKGIAATYMLHTLQLIYTMRSYH